MTKMKSIGLVVAIDTLGLLLAYPSASPEQSVRDNAGLAGLYPGTSIHSNTPAWLDAARITLKNRSDKSTGWAMAHRLNLWAIARGNFEVSAKWENGQATQLEVLSKIGGACTLNYKNTEKAVVINSKHETVKPRPKGRDVIEFNTEAGQIIKPSSGWKKEKLRPIM